MERPILFVVLPEDSWLTVAAKRAEARLRATDPALLGPAARLLLGLEKR